MHIEFGAADEKYIKESVKNGYFHSEAEAVRDAVRVAREKEANHSTLLGALRAGEEDIAAGRTLPYTRELMEQLTQEAIHQVKGGGKIAYDPNVIP